MNKRDAMILMLDGEKITDRNKTSEFGFLRIDEYGDFIDENGHMYDLWNDLESNRNYGIYQEPKKKVKMWQWVVKHKRSGRYCITDGFYFNALAIPEDLKIIQKADWTEIEVDEE